MARLQCRHNRHPGAPLLQRFCPWQAAWAKPTHPGQHGCTDQCRITQCDAAFFQHQRTEATSLPAPHCAAVIVPPRCIAFDNLVNEQIINTGCGNRRCQKYSGFAAGAIKAGGDQPDTGCQRIMVRQHSPTTITQQKPRRTADASFADPIRKCQRQQLADRISVIRPIIFAIMQAPQGLTQKMQPSAINALPTIQRLHAKCYIRTGTDRNVPFGKNDRQFCCQRTPAAVTTDGNHMGQSRSQWHC